MRRDTPPSSVNGDNEISGLDDEEMIYYGDDIDELIEDLEDGSNSEPDNDEDEENVELSDYNPPDNSKFTFAKHDGSVFCGALHPSGKFAVSGGEDDKAYVWDTTTGEVILECGEHSDSVVIASFSFDGVYLATVDMRGNIFVRKCPVDDNKSWDVVWSFQTSDILWGFWHPAAHVLVCCESEGDVYIWKVPSGEMKILKGHGQSSACGVFLRDGKRLAVGYDDCSIKIWDLKTSSSLFHITSEFSAPEEAKIICIDSYHDNNLVIAGTINGKILIAKSNTGKIIGNLSFDSPIESLKFSKNSSLGLVAIGTLGGSLSIWDVARQTLRFNCNNENAEGITVVSWVNDDIFASYFDGYAKIFDGKSGNVLRTLSGHKAEILDMNYHAETNIIMSASEDGTCKIFDLATIEN